jgi:hypothetical protein
MRRGDEVPTSVAGPPSSPIHRDLRQDDDCRVVLAWSGLCLGVGVPGFRIFSRGRKFRNDGVGCALRCDVHGHRGVKLGVEEWRLLPFRK